MGVEPAGTGKGRRYRGHSRDSESDEGCLIDCVDVMKNGGIEVRRKEVEHVCAVTAEKVTVVVRVQNPPYCDGHHTAGKNYTQPRLRLNPPTGYKKKSQCPIVSEIQSIQSQ